MLISQYMSMLMKLILLESDLSRKHAAIIL